MSQHELRDRVLDDNGAIVPTFKPLAKDSESKRQVQILQKKVSNLESALQFKREELTSVKQQLRESEPLLKQAIGNLQKENHALSERNKVLEAAALESTPVAEESTEEKKKPGFLDAKLGKHNLNG